jgi:hypothetical protein
MTDKEFLESICAQIEKTEQQLENEYGSMRTIDELIQNGEMPDCYKEARRRLEALQP